MNTSKNTLPHVAAFALSLVVTLGTMGSLNLLAAHESQTDAAATTMATSGAVQQVVIVAKRQA